MTRIDRERCEDWQDLRAEVVMKKAPCGRIERFRRDKANAVLGQARKELFV